VANRCCLPSQPASVSATDKLFRVHDDPEYTRADGAMRLWNLHTKKLLRRFEGHGPMVNSVSFTAAGRQALSGSSDKTLRPWTLPKPERAPK
jgi:WD40 repeat protein